LLKLATEESPHELRKDGGNMTVREGHITPTATAPIKAAPTPAYHNMRDFIEFRACIRSQSATKDEN
jgi:hypothetical protein